MSKRSEKNSNTVKRGPTNAPRLSPTPSMPNAFPRYSGATDSAINASRGAERLPAPRRSANLAPSTPGQAVAIPINGFDKAERTYPTSAIGFRFCNLSESHPEKPWIIFCVACAMPSMIPTILPPACRYCVR